MQRGRQLFALVGLFVVAVIALGRRRGALSLVGLGISLIIIVQFLVPALLSGRPPVLTAVVGASAVMLVVLLLAHGPGIRTATAIAGTAASLLLIVALSSTFVALTGLSGLTSDDDYFVQAFFGQALDLRGLLLAGIVIGALGILDDVTVTQVSLVWELRDANPTMPRRDLHAAALRVGRDHIASTVNTLFSPTPALRYPCWSFSPQRARGFSTRSLPMWWPRRSYARLSAASGWWPRSL